ncbi:hypothetical protein CRE_05115 [Caenorhabditis remanei]|uniref:Uncharacterized protein n=1 Tax=Caenorhabditis remanei TaxID=31234 RepID=E3N698_CAERE|nr:hypothetical protein CRE_05115 [Caenorhabditis remanei]
MLCFFLFEFLVFIYDTKLLRDSTVVPFLSCLSISSTPLIKEKLRDEAAAEERESPVVLFIFLPDGECFNLRRLKHLMALRGRSIFPKGEGCHGAKI